MSKIVSKEWRVLLVETKITSADEKTFRKYVMDELGPVHNYYVKRVRNYADVCLLEVSAM